MLLPISASLTALLPSQFCQAYFTLAASALLAIALLPASIQQLFVDYGSRTTSSQPRAASADAKPASLVDLARSVTSWGRIPHSWFISFYILSSAGSFFWVAEYLLDGNVLHFFISRQAAGAFKSMSLDQTIAIWALFAVHGLRRLLEHLIIMKTSTSKMWLPHWLFGVSFYLVMSVAIWIEGSGEFLDRWCYCWCVRESAPLSPLGALQARQDILSIPVVHRVLASPWLIVFALASAAQSWCHTYLAGLEKYSLPSAGMFQYIVCPHYTCECLIYISLVFLAAPVGKLHNQTILCAFLLVMLNLGITAAGTKRWYKGRYGEAAVGARWAMVPGVF
jgi:3-oxo-5-alpha-steroid 4-dehydrogenase 3 / polyprenol reductase